jgi:hypothetical protein
MDPLLLEKLVREIVQNEIIGNWLYWLLLLLVAFVAGSLGTYVTAYFKKRAEDQATLQALEKITRTVEEVKSELQARHTLRFAALDRRLQAHQKAFAYCRQLHRVLNDHTELTKVSNAMIAWFDETGLYLEKEAGQAFWDAYHAALSYNVAHNQPRDTNLMKINWQAILNSQQIIMQTVELPSLKLPGIDMPIAEAQENRSM